MRKAEMKANGLENRKITASSQWSMFKRIKMDDNDFLRSSNLIFCPINKKSELHVAYTMRKNLPKTLDQLIFCKYTLHFEQIY